MFIFNIMNILNHNLLVKEVLQKVKRYISNLSNKKILKLNAKGWLYLVLNV